MLEGASRDDEAESNRKKTTEHLQPDGSVPNNSVFVSRQKMKMPRTNQRSSQLLQRRRKSGELCTVDACKKTHDSDFNLKNFQISIVKKISPQNIRREKFKFIEKLRTIQLGLNRYKAS